MARRAGAAAATACSASRRRMARAAGEAPPPLPRRRAAGRSRRWLALCPARAAARRPLRHRAADRHACFALFAASLHFIMGPAGMVSFGHAAYFGLGAYAGALLFKKRRPADGAGARAGAVRSPACSARRLRLVLRAPVGRLSRDADARLRADRLVGRLPVGRRHRRQQRPGRHLAVAVAAPQAGLLLPDPRAAAAVGIAAAVAHAVLAVRLRAARRPRFAAARRGDRHRRARLQWAAFVARRHVRRAWPARSSPSPRAASRPTMLASRNRSTGW